MVKEAKSGVRSVGQWSRKNGGVYQMQSVSLRDALSELSPLITWPAD